MTANRSIGVRLAIGFLSLVFFMAIFADFLANDLPIVSIQNDGEVSFFSRIDKTATYTSLIYAPIKSKGGLDLRNTMVGPFDRVDHYFGTDHLGRDILAGVIHGGRTSIGISLIAIAIASLIGVLLGGIAGFLGDTGFRLSGDKLMLGVVIAFLGYYFLFVLDGRVFPLVASIVIVVIGYKMLHSKMNSRVFRIPLDLFALKFIEIFSAVPIYFLILALVAFIEPNWLLFSFLIGATSWVGIARLIRGEMIKIRAAGYIESAEALGLSKGRIFIWHAIPNALGPLPYALTFGIASIVVVESTLSYFGVGLPADSLSWGNFLSGFKNNNAAWWVAFFPGLMIFLTILSLHITGRWLDQKFNPREATVT